MNIDSKKITVKHIFFTWSNFISLSRILIAFPIIYLHYTNGQHITRLITALVVYGILSDYLDGYVARKTNNVSEWGKILDPVADKLAAFLLFVYVVYIGRIPVWFFAIEVLRDLVILSGSMYIRRLRGKVAMATVSGKVSINALSAYWIAAFFYPEGLYLQHFLMGVSLMLMIFSFFDYLHRFNEIRNGADFN